MTISIKKYTVYNMQSVTSNAVADYSAPKHQDKNQQAVFLIHSNWGIEVNEQQFPSTSDETWQPMLNVTYEQDEKSNSLGFFMNNLVLIKNSTERYFVMLNEMADGKPIVIKHKEITAVTNEHGTFVLTDERPISIMVMNINDAMCIIGNGLSGANLIPWVKVCNYNFTPLANTSVVLDMYYI